MFFEKQMLCLETSLVVQWLRIPLPMQGMWIQSLVRELRSHTLRGQLNLCAASRESLCAQHSQKQQQQQPYLTVYLR